MNIYYVSIMCEFLLKTLAHSSNKTLCELKMRKICTVGFGKTLEKERKRRKDGHVYSIFHVCF